MLVINKRITLFELFVVVMLFCQFRMETRQGYILLFLEMGIGCIYWMWSTKKIKLCTPIWKIYLLFVVYRIAFSVLTSGEGVRAIFYKELGMLFLCRLLFSSCSTIDIIKRVRDFGVINALLGCYEFFTHSSIFLPYLTVESRIYAQSLGTSKTRVQTIFMHPNICGVFMVVAWLCVLFIPYKKQWVNYLARVSIFLCLLGTQARSSWVSFVIVTAVYIVKISKGKIVRLKKSDIFWTCALICLVLSGVIFFNEYIWSIYQIVKERWLDGMNSNNAGNYNRVTMIKMGMQEWTELGIKEKIFGAGNRYAYKLLLRHPIRGWKGAVDNQYLTVLLDFGMVGFFMLLFLVGYAFKKSITNDDEISRLCGLCLLSMFISSFFYEMFSWITVTTLFCLFLCIIEQRICERDTMGK